MKYSSILALCGALVSLTSCKGATEPPDSGSLRFGVAKVSILLDDTLTTAAVVTDSRNNPVTNVTVTYTSANPGVASVEASGRVHAVALGTTTVTASEAGKTALLEVTVVPHFIEIGVGGRHTCGITGKRELYCWGLNEVGELGVSASSPDCQQQVGAPCSLVPIPVIDGGRFTAVTLGLIHTCALTDSGDAYCWGGNFDGAAGIGTADDRATIPTPVAGGRKFVFLAAGYLHTCGITVQGETYCWGLDNTGQLGAGVAAADRCNFAYPDSPCSRIPVKVTGGQTFVQVAGSTLASCGRTAANTIYCWGLGIGAPPANECEPGRITACTRTPLLQASGMTFPVFGMGDIIRCGQTPDGNVYCWGADYNNFGNGSGSPISSGAPILAAGGKSYQYPSVSVGYSHVCGLGSGALECWGDGTQGQVGGSVGTSRNVPGPVNSSGITFSKIFSGAVSATNCGIATTGRAYCWGAGQFGQLGNNSVGSSAVPVLVKLVR